MARPETLPDASHIQTYIRILQDVIARMGSNSRFCKAWCIALMSAVLVLVARTEINPTYVWIAAIPLASFLVLDTYYLTLERGFRTRFECVIELLHGGTLGMADLYIIRPTGNVGRTFLSCLVSWAIWPFYGMLLGMLTLLSILLGNGGPNT